MNATIKKIEYHLPDTVVDNRQLEQEFTGWSAEKIEKKVGIKQRRVTGENETALDIGCKAACKAIENFPKDEIDFLILCTQSPDYFLPTSACILQDMLGLRSDIGAFDFNLGCSGYVYGLAISKGLICSGISRCVLLVTTETYSKFLHPKDKAGRTVFGDGATATILERSQTNGILEFALGTDGSGYRNLIVPNGGLRNRYNANAEEITDDMGNTRTDNNLFMNGPEIFNFTIDAVPKLINDILKKNSLAMDQIDHFVFHQANKYMLEYLRKVIKIPEEKYYVNMLYTGNTVSSSIPIALKDCLSKKVISKEDNVLIAGFGVGYSWGGTIIKF